MTPKDALLAGIKTSIITFLAGVVLLVVGLLDELSAWASAGNPPDLAVLKGGVLVLVSALATGVLNTAARYVQVAAVPFLGTFVDKILGQVPKYLVPPAVGPVDEVGGDGVDRGESVVIVLVAVLAAVALVIWISRAL